MIDEVKSLPEIRDLLLPGLWMINNNYGTDYESDIHVDFKLDKLLIKVFRFSTKKLAIGEITRHDVENDLYKSMFAPKVKRLFDDLG